MQSLTPPPVVEAVAAACAQAGGRCFLVGGSVRDHLMDLPVKDWDIEVYGLPTDELEAALRTVGRVNTVGKAFSVFKLMKHGVELDISIPRRDNKKGPGHRGIEATGDPTMTPAEAARRRDLTVNAIMLDLHSREIVDPAGGRADIEAKRLAPVDETTFLEDPLRALRAAQFVARLAFDATPELEALCRAAALDELPAERVQGEWAKLLLKAEAPSLGMAFARRTDVLARVFPEHPSPPERDAWLDRAAAARADQDSGARKLALMLATWLAGLPTDASEATLDRLKLFRWEGKPCRDLVVAAAAHVHDPIATDADLRWLSTRADVELTLAVRAAVTGQDTAHAHVRAASLGVLRQAPPRLLLGRRLLELGAKPGPALGRILDAVYTQQLNGTVDTAEAAEDAARALMT